MKLRIWALLLFAWVTTAWSQTGLPKEVVHLKNGSVLRGTITEWVPEVSLTIQLAGNSVFVCPIGDVAKVTREFAPSSSEEPKVLRAAPVSQEFEFFASLGYGISSGKYGLDVTNFNLGYGKNLTANHFVGLGTGLRYFLTENEFAMMPFYAEYRGRMERGNISPYTRIYEVEARAEGVDTPFLFSIPAKSDKDAAMEAIRRVEDFDGLITQTVRTN